MSFLTGKTVPATAIPGDVAGLRGSVIRELSDVDPLTGLSRSGGIPPAYFGLFEQSLAPILAQAKESAGNLTGSGLGNIMGAAAGRSLSDFLLNLLSQTGGRAAALTSGLIQPQPVAYKPGFLDYLFGGAQAAAPFLAPLFGPTRGAGATTP